MYNLATLISASFILFLSFYLSPTHVHDQPQHSIESQTSSSQLESSDTPITKTYCTGIRGNGELAPAHWASLAKIIEKKKSAPVGGAGGSSGSITMFILENFFNSPLIYKNNVVPDSPTTREGLLSRINEIDHNKLAFLFKFLTPYLEKVGKLKVTEYSQFLVIKEVVGKMQVDINADEVLDEKAVLSDDSSSKRKLKSLLNLIKKIQQIRKIETDSGNKVSILKTISQAKKLNKDSNSILDDYYLQWDDELKELFSNLKSITKFNNFKKNSPQKLKNIRNLITNFKETIAVFGKFDVENDHNLFFRPGLIDFQKFGFVFNGLLSFFNHSALNDPGSRDPWVKKMYSFFNHCSNSAKGHLWIPKNHKDYKGCMNRFNRIITDYYTGDYWKNSKNNIINEDVGRSFAAIVTTSIIKGDGYNKSIDLRNKFYRDRELVTDDVPNFSVDFDRDLFLGYWYNQNYTSLAHRVTSNNSDPKSKKFLNLGNINWHQVFATSPAEPGLTNFRPFTSNLPKLGKLLSSGGWSDLHPTIVLNELHDEKNQKICDDVYYITRTAGGSNFGQMLQLKLLGLKDTMKIKSHKNSCDFGNEKLNTLFNNLKNQITDVGQKNLSLFDWMPLVNSNSNGCIELSDEVLNSEWAKLNYWYNNNHISSFKKSADIASDVFCTNWNNFDVLAGEAQDLIVDTYYNSIWRSEARKADPEAKKLGCW